MPPAPRPQPAAPRPSPEAFAFVRALARLAAAEDVAAQARPIQETRR